MRRFPGRKGARRLSPPLLWALALPIVGCGSSDVVPAIEEAPHASASNALAPAAAEATVALPSSPKTRPVNRLEEAYRARRNGKVEEANSAFEEVASALRKTSIAASPGLGDGRGYVVQSRTATAVTTPEGTLFFDASTGEPFAFAARLALREGEPALDGARFVTEASTLYDARLGEVVALDGEYVASNTKGGFVYTVDKKCRVLECDVATGHAKRTLAPLPRSLVAQQIPAGCADCECHAEAFGGAAVSTNGRWLSTVWGRFNLDNGGFVQLPFEWISKGSFPAISRDGHYIAFVRADPKAPKDGGGDRTLLALLDLDAGTTALAQQKLPALSNGHPLAFGQDPPRICVYDYGEFVFEVPGLKLVARKEQPRSATDEPTFRCEGPPRPAPLAGNPALALLASKVCWIDGLALPLEACSAKH